MSDNVVIFWSVLFKCSLTALAIVGAVYLAAQGKEGWGWLIALALCIGCFSVIKTDE